MATQIWKRPLTYVRRQVGAANKIASRWTAPTDGGSIYIGVNDDGYIVGAKDSKRLLEGLPNKINDKLGVLASVKVFTGRQGIIYVMAMLYLKIFLQS